VLINFPISSVMIMHYAVLDLLQGAKIWAGETKDEDKTKLFFAKLALKIMRVTRDPDTRHSAFFYSSCILFHESTNTLHRHIIFSYCY
jgi:hypothetical protein